MTPTPEPDTDPATDFYSARRPLRTAARRATVAIAGRRWATTLLRHVQPRMDRGMYALTRGRYSTMTLFTGLLLTTTGRRSGLPRSVPLLYIEHRDRFYLTGSNSGRAAHPEWTANLLANPEAVITVKGRRHAVTARLLEGDERQRIWPVLTAIWPPYDIHTARSGRTLRVFELTVRDRSIP
ncbi:nitroreductase family deazaflavin-dependent oxidoreductase [Nocardia sp. NPDC101769]|uniref:nitroreductase family deazaflavin-dependent oxidoreductase n=1 Tax=Nocardia sp. NPDC101769 TaxID=3364333 RepID=UPI0037F1AD2F